MDIELMVKVLGGISAALAIAERAYNYAQKASQSIWGGFHINTSPSLPGNRSLPIVSSISPKKNQFVLLCKRNQLSPFLKASLVFN